MAGIRVLYVNHTGQVSGGEKSLLELLRGASPSISPIVACPDGPLADAVAGIGVGRVSIPDVDGSLKLHPWRTLVALAAIARGVIAVRAVAKRYGVSVIHANTIRAGLLVALGRTERGPATVVHLRDRLPDSRLSRLTLKVIGRADLLMTNSRYTAESLDDAGVMSTRWVIGNPVDLQRFDPERIDRSAARRSLGLAETDYATTVLAQITPWKGQEEAIRAVAQLRADHPNVRLLLVGSAKFVSKATRYDNRAYLERLHHLVDELELRNHVNFVGERDDVPDVLRASDTLLIPSWEEPFGRSMIEAMAMGVPVIATTVGGPAEVIADQRDGLLVRPRMPEAWATAIRSLIESSALRSRLAENGRLRARAFSVEAHIEQLSNAYSFVTGEPAMPGVVPTDVPLVASAPDAPAVPATHPV